MAFNSVEPTRDETFGVGPNRARQVQEKYDALNAEIEKQIAQANEARRMSGLSGELSSSEEQKIADQVTASFRSKEAGRAGPPAPESLAAAVSARKKEEVGPPSSAAAAREATSNADEEGGVEGMPQDTTLMDTVKKSWMTSEPGYPGPTQPFSESPVAAEPEKPSTLKDAVQKATEKQKEPGEQLSPGQVPYAPGKIPTKAVEKEKEKEAAPTKVAGVSVPAEPKPTQIQSIFDKYEKRIADSQAGVKKEMGTQLQKLQDLETVYRNEAKAAKDEVARRELAENMGHALAQLGAGIQGIKTGVDMSSGLKFSKTDWNKRYEQAIDELKANLADLREKRGEVKAVGLEGLKEAERRGERGMGMEAAEQTRKESAAATAKLAAAKQAWDEQQRSLDRKSKEQIELFKASLKQSAAEKKLTEQEQAGSDAAAGSLLGAWSAVSEAENDKEKAIAEKRALQLETDPKVTRYLTPTAIQSARKTALGTPSTLWNWWSGDEADLPAAQKTLELGKILRTGTTPSSTPATTVTGQAPAAGGTVWRQGKDGKLYEFDAATKKPTGNVK